MTYYCFAESENHNGLSAIVRSCFLYTVKQEVQTDEQKRSEKHHRFGNCSDRDRPNRKHMLFPLCLSNLAFRVQVYRRGVGPLQAGTGVRRFPATCWERRTLGMPFGACVPELSHRSQAARSNPATARPPPCRNPDAGQILQHEQHAG